MTSTERITADPPSDFAWTLGVQFGKERTAEQRKASGQFITPIEVARFMAGLATAREAPSRILDPGAGTGILSCAMCEAIPAGTPAVHIDAYEADARLADLCEQSFHHAREWLSIERGVSLTFAVHRGDFILENADRLRPPLFGEGHPEPAWYDAAIMNPPYFKLPKSDPRAVAAASVVHGQPNIYSLFMGIAVSVLAPGGVMVSITPRSFAGGDYFRRFRQHLFEIAVPEAVHLFASRKDAFREDAVLQENVILRTRRAEVSHDATVEVSQSLGIRDLAQREVRHVPLSSVIDVSSSAVTLNIPASEIDDDVVEFLRRWHSSLKSWRLDVSTGPVVAFRTEEFLRPDPDETTVPLLWLNNVRPLAVEWPLPNGKPQHISARAASRKLLVPNGRNYVLLRRFTAKEERRRLLAAPLYASDLPGEMLGLENHLNYVYRPHDGLSEDEAAGLAALFNSALLDRYIRISNGNTQVNASELRSLPLPDPVEVSKIGRHVRSANFEHGQLDTVISEELDLPSDLAAALDPRS